MPRRVNTLEIKVDSNVDRVRDRWSNFMKHIPEIEKKNSKRIAEFFANAIRTTIRSKLYWRGNMLKGVDVRRTVRGAGDYDVIINAPIVGRRGDYAAWNEFASRPHEVIVSRQNRPIDLWADAHGIPRGTTITVKPEPFMNESVRQASRRMKQYLAKGGELDEFLRKFTVSGVR